MAAPDPAVVERQMYVDMHLNGVDDPTLTLAELREMGPGASHVHRAATSDTTRYATKAELAVVAETALSGGGGGPDPGALHAEDLYTAYSRDAAFTAAAANCGPKNFIKTYRVISGVTQSLIHNVYPTITAAIAQVIADNKLSLNNLAPDTSRVGPEQWRQIVVSPGNYNEDSLGVPNFCSLVSSTGDYRDVRVWSAGNAGSGALLGTGGNTCHVAGITFDFTGDDENWHPWRDGGPGGNADDTDDRQKRTVIVERCKFLVSSPTAAQGCSALDATAGRGVFLLVVGCIFQQDNGVQVINCVSNTSTAGSPGTYVFIDNYIRLSHTQRGGQDAPVGGLNDAANPVGLVDMGGGRGDSFYWMGGVWDFGDGLGYLGAPAPGVNSGVSVSYQPVVGVVQSTKWYIDPNIPAGSYDGEREFIIGPVGVEVDVLPQNVFYTVELPILPVDGVSKVTQEAYGVTTQTKPIIEEDAAYMRMSVATTRASLVANRIYYVRIPISKAFLIGRALIGTSGAKGVNHAVGIYADDGTGNAPETDANLRTTYSPVVPVLNIDRVIVGEATNRRPYYPLHKYLWVAFVASSATPTYDTATSQTDYPVLYFDGWAGGALGALPGVLTALPGGTVYPVLTLQHYDLTSATVLSTLVGTLTYNIPPGARALDIVLIGQGGGGGSGRRGAAGTVRTGGGGGGGGTFIRQVVPVSTLTSPLAFQFTSGGVGGAARTTDDTDGQAGTSGGAVIAKTNTSIEFMRASGGGGGAAGTSGAAAGGSGTAGAIGTSGAGGGSQVSGNGVAGGIVGGLIGGGGGGGGGTLTNANVATAGGAGGGIIGITATAGSPGANTGAAGGNGAEAQHGTGTGPGAGGGGANTAGASGNGGAGGSFGGGGGGGAGSLNGNNSGAGGNGGNGAAIIVPIF